MEADKVRAFVNSAWSQSVLPALQRYIEIPNQSPAFDPQWRERGHMDEAVDLIVQWVCEQRVSGLEVRVVRAEKRTPLILVEVAGQSELTALLYGHIDKQPPMEGWREGLGPWKPVVEGGKLYGRGGADDGYAVFAAITAIKALQEQGVPVPRCVVLIEASEESGSIDLPYYIGALADRIGRPSLVVCLDSGCGNYDQLWVTTSLRGLVSGELKVQVLAEGVHSGPASGVVPSSFRVLRQLLSRLEDEDTGEILPPELHVQVPEERMQQARAAAAASGMPCSRITRSQAERSRSVTTSWSCF